MIATAVGSVEGNETYISRAIMGLKKCNLSKYVSMGFSLAFDKCFA